MPSKVVSDILQYIYAIGSVLRAHRSLDADASDKDKDKQANVRRESLRHCVVAVAIIMFSSTLEWSVRWVPLYNLMKSGLLLWLMAPNSRGSRILYRVCIRPAVRALVKIIASKYPGGQVATLVS